ncbi:MAG: glutaredoxin family protein [Chloroflexi bacterium]|nr:glutaredoxin family protein [Chloroflexota bacterium]
MEATKVFGENKGNIMMYTLSTCGWCRKTKEFLKNEGLEYSYLDVDLLTGQDRRDAMDEIVKWNPSPSFPTIIINDKNVIVGYNEEKIKGALGL